ncbi:SprT-like domain-containing protein [Catellatospora sichuanensis]|uniref:SprT-like domain-containing protein n=1 Tax=Catellatospora sichuanensis TaxID=1969805 RepID=UPI0011837904|nr:SprT-like domain-containing protein [Catellatospora sichuanensis]
MTAIHTRESWLLNAVEALRPRFAEVGMPIPEKLHVSVGFGFGAKAESSVILGQCWAKRASDDGVNHIFIAPTVGDTARVLDILIHELIHAADDCQNGHKGAFAEAATRLGLEGKMTATVASLPLAAEMLLLAETLGEYPHGVLSGAVRTRAPKVPVPATPGDGEAGGRISSGPGTQGTRMLKLECPCCGYTVRTTAKWLAVGFPSCPSGTEMIAA